jgi:hypothetical protein
MLEKGKMDCRYLQLSRRNIRGKCGLSNQLGLPFGSYQKEKTLPRRRNTEACCARARSGITNLDFFQAPVQACQYKKQSFINETGVKLISRAHSFYAFRALYS